MNNKGFTLIELLVVIVILGVVGAILLPVILSGGVGNYYEGAKVNAQG